MKEVTLMLLGAAVLCRIFVIIARDEIQRDATATRSMWARTIEHYTPRGGSQV